MNVAPSYTLDTVEAIVTYPQVLVRGLLLTLKLPEWTLAAELPVYLDRVRSWGYPDVRARQLQHNRQEICLAALRPIKKPRVKKPAVKKPPIERGGVERPDSAAGLQQHAGVEGLAAERGVQQ